tara:strand:- start:2490 stop:3101 length:612 start_codon:yes stop_codon:yes gene_type:complete
MIIGMCGLIGTGKDTVADILVNNYNFIKVSFADKLKDGVATVFSWDRNMLEGTTDESRTWREQKDEFWSRETNEHITPRLVLQMFGTDCMRNGFYNGIWVSIVKQQIINNPNKNFVIPDVRFPNEAKMIKEVNGEVWRICRGKDPQWFTSYVKDNIVPTDVHESEWQWAKLDFDCVITNNDTLTDLKNQVSDHLVSNELLSSA